MRSYQSILACSAMVLLTMVFASTARAEDIFAGGWQVKCTPYSATMALGADAFDDGFLFENDQFSAQAYAGLGFTPGAYTVDSTGKFTATLTSSDRGTVVWKGRAATGSIHGWITWTKPDGTIFKYSYTGTAVVPGDATADATGG